MSHYGAGDNYNRGDYYTGDYYRGDFFGLGKALKSFVGGVGRVAGAALSATPVGRALTAVKPLLHPSLPPPKMLTASTGMGLTTRSFGGNIDVPPIREPGVTGAVHRLVPGGHTGYGRMTKGPHPHFTERARPRMQWSNARALGRAERRIRSAVRHMTKYIRWVHPTKKGHAAPKFGKKK